MVTNCCLCGRELVKGEAKFASWHSIKPFSQSCVDKFKQAKKELAGKSDDEIISSIRLRQSHTHQQGAVVA